MSKDLRPNTNASTDPDFGHKPIHQAKGYKVVVTPHGIRQCCWEFVALVPVDLESAEALVMVREICEWALNLSDRYNVYELSPEDADTADDFSIVAFDPDNSEVFYWLHPPLHMMN